MKGINLEVIKKQKELKQKTNELALAMYLKQKVGINEQNKYNNIRTKGNSNFKWN